MDDDYEAVVRRLKLHGPGVEDPTADEARLMDTGFIGMLRPFSGLVEANFYDVMNCIIAVAEQNREGPTVDRRVVHALLTIAFYSRAWALDPTGMLQRNNLLCEADTNMIRRWILAIEDATHEMLLGRDPARVLADYERERIDEP